MDAVCSSKIFRLFLKDLVLIWFLVSVTVKDTQVERLRSKSLTGEFNYSHGAFQQETSHSVTPTY